MNDMEHYLHIMSYEVPGEYFIHSPSGAITHDQSLVVGGSWIPADGRAVSRIDYWELFALMGDVYGAGDGATTFNVPDMTVVLTPNSKDGRRWEWRSAKTGHRDTP